MIYIISILDCFCNGLLGINFALYLSQILHLSTATSGKIILFSSILNGISVLTLSPLIDKIGVKKPLLFGALLLLLSRGLLGLISASISAPLPFVILAIILSTVGSGLKSSSILVYLRQANKSFKLDYVLFNMAYMVAGIVYDIVHFPNLIYILAAGVTLINLVCIYSLPQIGLEKRETKLPPYDFKIAGKVLLYNLAMTPVTCIFSFLSNPFPSIVLKLFGPDAPVGKIYGSLNPLIIFITVPLLMLYSRYSKKSNIIRTAIIGTIISAASLTLVFLPLSGYLPILLAVSVFTIGEAIWSPSNMEIGTKMCPAGLEGRYMTLALFPKIISGAFMSIFATYTLEYLPGYSSFLYVSLFASITPIMLYMFYRDKETV